MTAAGAVCRSCGATAHEGARFCADCGTSLAASGQSAEYKQVTVLFADVVRSMDLAANLDVERLREIMTELVERSASVVRRCGGIVQHTGDGVMGLFGAPVALEDHALRACRAALDIQATATSMAGEVGRRDGVALRMRVGLNSGRVIAGDVGSGSLGYAATGEPVGMAQRMQAVAPPGGILLSESTAQLVEHRATLAEPEWVHVKGSDAPLRARRLVAIGARDGLTARDATLVGRRWEMAALDAMIERTATGHGGILNLVGPPGIGKSRVAREAAELAMRRGVAVSWGFCESHARDIPFHAVTRLLRAGSGAAGLDDAAARARMRERLPGADPQDLLLFDDLLGIADPGATLPPIDPEARRRRLTALVNTATRARAEPALFIIEDAQWIDAVSEAMLVEFLGVVPSTPSMVLITSRPDYGGMLARLPAAQTIVLTPLDDSEMAEMLGELLGVDPSVRGLTAIVAERAAGNPFFAEEMVRELAQRGVLTGERGRYSCHADVADIAVPATVQAAIAARIDRLSFRAKQTLSAASAIGMRFDTELLRVLGVVPDFDELLGVELIDREQIGPHAEYAFRHPLIRAVAYESQLRTDRARWHRRLATAIQDREPDSVEENAALIAEHLQAAGDPLEAYGWHMRAAARSVNRDLDAARGSWERARRIADGLPADNPVRLSLRIAPRTMLCATAWHPLQETPGRFAELRELCTAADDKVSLAIAMSGPIAELMYTGRSRDGSALATEQMTLLESVEDSTPTMALAFVAFCTWFDSGDIDEILRWSQTVIDLADGDPAKGGGFGMASPLAAALAWRGVARSWLGRGGWHQDFDDAVAMARNSNPAAFAAVTAWAYGSALTFGGRLVDDALLGTIEGALQTARSTTNDVVVALAELTLGSALLSRDAPAERRRGLELMVLVRGWMAERAPFLAPVADVWVRRGGGPGERDAAIPVMRRVVDELHQAGRLSYLVWATGVLVETLLARGAAADLIEAQEQIDRLATLPADGIAIRDITALRLRTLLACARGDAGAARDLVERYHAMAASLGFEGHLAWADDLRKNHLPEVRRP
ncbi:MAG: AAA family ATPase [Actinobacteria bacterium]|nr:AAA family ATPase [Actinomycetota bacterium]